MRIVVPRGAEARAVRRAGARDIVEVRAGAASAASLPEFAKGETVIVMGLCGALRELRAGAVVVYARVADDADVVEPDRELTDAIVRAVPRAQVVRACTAERIVTRASERAALARRYDADVVDMEGVHLAAAFGARGLRFAMVRVVSDDPTRDLPPIGDAVDAQGGIRPLRIALAFARAPRAAFAFVRDVRGALATLTETARTVGALR